MNNKLTVHTNDVSGFTLNEDINGLKKGWYFKRQKAGEAFVFNDAHNNGTKTSYRIWDSGFEKLVKDQKLDAIFTFQDKAVELLTYLEDAITKVKKEKKEAKKKEKNKVKLYELKRINNDLEKQIKSLDKINEDLSKEIAKLREDNDEAKSLYIKAENKATLLKEELSWAYQSMGQYQEEFNKIVESDLGNIVLFEEKINSLIEYYKERYENIEILDELEFDKKEEKNVLWNILHVLKYIKEND